jgi:N-acetylneuraminic acid mutarotase
VTTVAPVAIADYAWDQVADGAPWGGRAGLRVVELDGDLLVLGGRTPKDSPIPGDSELWGDVWRSADDGVTWDQIAETGEAFPARAYFQAVTLNDEVYVLGGQNFGLPSSTFFNDVWRSADGVGWEQVTGDAPWAGRAGLMAAVLDDQIYVFGGSRNDDSAVVGPSGPQREYFNDVWRSGDGAEWEEVTSAAPWQPRAGGAVVVKEGELYLLGGEEGFVCSPQPDCEPPYFNDVWKTTDGETWQEVTAEAEWSSRPGHQCELLDATIVCFGGFGQPENPVDMWASEDGAAWRLLPQSPWDADGPDAVRYDFDSVAVTDGPGGSPAIVTVGGDRETFDFTDPENYLRVDDDVWTFAAAG